MARPIRNRFLAEQFAKRLQIAMDSNPDCPPKYHGERVWLAERLLKLGVSVGVETVRKWVEGESTPSPDKIGRIAEALRVDAQWLMFGDTVPPSDAPQRSFEAAALTNLVAGLIALDGSTVSFPAEGTGEKNVHLHAVMRGANYPLHIVSGEALEGGQLTFRAPIARSGVIVLGVVRTGWGAFEIYELDEQTIVEFGTYERGSVAVTGSASAFRQVTTFKERL